jgi:subtilisin family serine protease
MLHLDAARLLLCFSAPITLAEVEALGKKFNFIPEGPRIPIGERERYDSVNHTPTRFWVRTREGKAFDAAALSALAEKLPNLAWIAPVYEERGKQGLRGRGCPLPYVLLIKPRTASDPQAPAKLAGLLANLGLKENPAKSRYLGGYGYFAADPKGPSDAYAMRATLLKNAPELLADVLYEYMPMIVGLTIVPDDTHFDRQWNMRQIAAGGPGRTGWDISTGVPGVVICILDWGCDRSHPDLSYVSAGINLGTMTGDGEGVPGIDRYHGTCCAGIVAARVNNGTGVAGVAGGCRIMPVAMESFTNAEVAAGINYATAHGAMVISMSFVIYEPDSTISVVIEAMNNAVDVHDCVLVAASGNENRGVHLDYPAAHGKAIAVGGSDHADNRKSPTSPDAECWGANYGNISVVAPAVLIPTTDRRGTDGLNTTGGGPDRPACVTYPVSGDAAGDYVFVFNGTSAAAPHVAGLAALLRSHYPALTGLEVRSIIERTAEKVGTLPYADNPVAWRNGPRNEEMGYGRINVFRALDFADVFIKDWPSDNGVEPSAPPDGVFWAFSDIVIRPSDDDLFDPTSVAESSRVERGRTHYLSVRVTNSGPAIARGVAVNVRITPYVGTEFIFPADWMNTDTTHIAPGALAGFPTTLAPGATAIAKFEVTSDQIEELWGWTIGRLWHPCVLASVTAENDYASNAATAVPGLVTRRNNLAQRNLSLIGVLGAPPPPDGTMFPFIAGNHFNAEPFFEIVVDRSELSERAEVLLELEADRGIFPRVDFSGSNPPVPSPLGESLVLREPATLDLKGKHWRGAVTLAKGSRFDPQPTSALTVVAVKGGEVVLRGQKRFVLVRANQAVVRLSKSPKRIYPMAVRVVFPSDAKKGLQHLVHVAQRNEKSETVGGATAVFHVA